MPANTNPDTDTELGIRDLRNQLSDRLMDVAVEGEVIYVTNRGKRVAALAPIAVVRAGLEALRPGGDPSA
ncbi:type II toxin-antitoxin system Phd/YefM family antitoxin [Streptomyces sp. NPDC057250]|uniref:type II toxin-antitoxin system Phd/YefM family antitoxin n=1 Tax=Streptomyces sp. NPDC057250 TaxID=3346068 RepID=UPI003644EB8A